ncbi:serine hydrolase domain-containing protein [Steroidobacter sp.]|uniref:serine hydrolase domain-containing protein n=1 Tax=Steroidobacter sp. TaxID=1978227 RepID=UPI001A5D3148|nr:serine hydrolase domain-containing protein [Steroidobacter sp.]MBL8267345.1 beta-lactamase family protein [Steroidobacter sp.]
MKAFIAAGGFAARLACLSSALLLAVAVFAAPCLAADGVEAQIDALFAEYSNGSTPGAAVGVYRGGQIVFAKGYGLADLEYGVAITPQTQFHVASVSKQFTAFAIALLAREGKLDLQADVRQYLPFFPDLGHKITPQQFVYHTSGVRDQMALFQMGGKEIRDVLRQEQVVNMMSRQRGLNFAPGSNYMYSNMGYCMLAEIVRSVSGQSLRQFTTQRMFEPLGMSRTFFFDDVRELVPGRANSYQQEKDGRWLRTLLNYNVVGTTGLFTTIEDLARWTGNFSKPRVGDAALIEQVTRGGTLTDGTPTHYGFGLIDSPVGGRTAISHSGSDASFKTFLIYYPENDLAIAVLANTRMAVEAKAQTIADLYLPPAPPAKPQSKPREIKAPAWSKRLPGAFISPAMIALTFEQDGKQLLARRRTPGQAAPVIFLADGRFTFDMGDWERASYQPVFSADGDIVALEQKMTSGLPGARFERAAKISNSTVTLSALAGDYRSDELDVTYSFSVENGSLVGRMLWLVEPIKFKQITADYFDSESYTGWVDAIRFERDADGVATALNMRMVAGIATNLVLRRVSKGK